MKRILIFTFVVLAACSSGDDLIQTPENLISTDKIIPIIVDLQVLESHYQRLYGQPNLYKTALDSSSNLVFQSFDVSRADFENSFAYYSSDLNIIYSIYEAALDSINFRINQKSF